MARYEDCNFRGKLSFIISSPKCSVGKNDTPIFKLKMFLGSIILNNFKS